MPVDTIGIGDSVKVEVIRNNPMHQLPYIVMLVLLVLGILLIKRYKNSKTTKEVKRT